MATVSPVLQNPNGGVREQEIWKWEGVANDDTITMLDMPFTFGHVSVQLRGTVPASTVFTLKGGVDNDATKAADLVDGAAAALTLDTENAMVFLNFGVPAFFGFAVTGGAAGSMDIYLVRKFI